MILPSAGEVTVGGVVLAWASWLSLGVIASKAEKVLLKDTRERVVRIEDILLEHYGPPKKK